jgi:hypothetical protein
MSNQVAASEATKAIGDPFGTLAGWVAGFVPEGPLRTLFIVVVGLCVLAVPFVYKYYLGLLAQGAQPEGSLECQDYEKLRASLKEGNLASRLYAKWLTKFLDWIERFFGDAGRANRTLFPHAFGLKKPAPFWTAPAFDRCLLLALIYPIATIFLIWAISSHVGPAEAALGLKRDVQVWLRGSAVASLLFASFALFRAVRMERWQSLALNSVAVVFLVGFAVAVAVMLFSVKAFKHRWQGLFLAVFLPAMIVACLGAAELLRVEAGPLLLLLGLFTPLNAPFDWVSLGLTRALLRRGLELGGWWPYLLALIDACLAAVIIALLALTMVIGVQAFDELAVHGGGEKAAVLPLDALFDGIAKNPAAPEYWWAYALLLATMIPSLINLAISGMAFTRGIPGVSRVLLNWIPEGRDVPEYKRQPAAIGLTIQMFTGAFLGIAA